MIRVAGRGGVRMGAGVADAPACRASVDHVSAGREYGVRRGLSARSGVHSRCGPGARWSSDRPAQETGSEMRGNRASAATAVLAALMMGCGGQGETGRSPTTVVISPETGAIMPLATGPGLAAPCRTRPANVTGFWSPTPGQIALLEARLPDAVNPLVRRVEKDLGALAYYRQYIGLVHGDGRRTIYVNAFESGILSRGAGPVPDPAWWRTKPVDYCDGWLGFWSIEYDVKTGDFSGFAHNGRA